MMSQPSNSNALVGQIVKVARSDRWLVYRRLQELTIPCWCPSDGSLWVEVNHSIAAILVRSTIEQFTASRQELVEWLERCWDTEAI
jgi:hypothetical protein